MKKIITNLLVSAVALACSSNVDAGVEKVAPEGEIDLFRSSCMYTDRLSAGWNVSTMQGNKVCFDGDKLYIEGLCGCSWIEGEINESGDIAVFKSGEYVEDATRLMAQRISGSDYIDVDEFRFSISPDHTMLDLLDCEGDPVMLFPMYDSGYTGIYWKYVTLDLWTLDAPAMPAEGELQYLSVDYEDGWGDSNTKYMPMKIIGDEVWIKGMVYDDACMQGKVLQNGNLHFETPQYQCFSARYFQFAFARINGDSVYDFDLELQEDGSYVLQDGVSLWRGDMNPDYCVLQNAVFTPVDLYVGAPAKPENVVWDGDFDHCVDFTLPMTGVGGEELNPAWTYWQILANDEPFTFTNAEYGGWLFFDDPDKVCVEDVFYSRIDGESCIWGAIGNNEFFVYLPSFAPGDNISVRCGYEVGGEMYWSEAVAATESSEVTPLPEEALYFTSVSIDTEYGTWATEGNAMFAEYSDGEMLLSGFFERAGYCVGVFADDKLKEAVFESEQMIGVADDGQEISLVAALRDEASGQFIKQDSFTLSVGRGGKALKLKDRNIYLLEVTGAEITNVWCPDFNLTLVTDKVVEVPEDAERQNYLMTYRNTLEMMETRDVEIATCYDEEYGEYKVYISGIAGEGSCIEGYDWYGMLCFDLPQFVGVQKNLISYVTAEPWSFDYSSITFTKNEEGEYTSDDEIWVGYGFGWPLWREAYQITLTPLETGVASANADEAISFEGGRFVTASGSEAEVYTLAGVRVANKALGGGVYVVKANGKTAKIAVK